MSELMVIAVRDKSGQSSEMNLSDDTCRDHCGGSLRCFRRFPQLEVKDKSNCRRASSGKSKKKN